MVIERKNQTLADLGRQINDGDLLLFRGKGLFSRLIRTAGRSDYSHAAMVCYCKGIPCVLEMREGAGGRCVTLASQVARFPGRIDLFSVDAQFGTFRACEAAKAMLLKCGHEYNWRGLLAAAMIHLPFIRLMTTPDLDDATVVGELPEFCSQAVASACRVGGGIDPVPFLGDKVTEPGDLARSKLWQYRATLIG